MKIYVIRHGETDSNLKNIVAGIKEDLNLNGIKQAEAVREKIENLNIDSLFVLQQIELNTLVIL